MIARTNQVCPHFFQIKKGNKISYVLGTSHHIPLDELPPCVHEAIKGIKNFVSEVSSVKDHLFSEESLYELGMLSYHADQHWFNELTLSLKTIFTKFAENFFQNWTSVKNIPYTHITPHFASSIVVFGFRENREQGMDHDLGQLIPNRYALEGEERLQSIIDYTSPKSLETLLTESVKEKKNCECRCLEKNQYWF